ncbi:hypothetical protein [Nonomuraea sp. NPDC046570]|uniref:hypothetical protein n=1 Tax=Nonomuraea sp. NPDC046570 TaxID=3155255 RepID=UPI0033D4771A
MTFAPPRELAPEVFLRLVAVGESGHLSVRHADLAELAEGRPLPEVASVTRILEVFGYLLGRDDKEVWLSHPALPHARCAAGRRQIVTSATSNSACVQPIVSRCGVRCGLTAACRSHPGTPPERRRPGRTQ